MSSSINTTSSGIENTHWVLTLACQDMPGIVHAVTGAIVAANGNITESKQVTSDETGRFFMRLQIETAAPREHLERQLDPVMARYDMEWELDVVGRKMRTLILVSKSAHCLNDLMFRQRKRRLSKRRKVSSLAQIRSFNTHSSQRLRNLRVSTKSP